MKTEMKITGDGSHTLYLPEIDEHYHSTFGALNESRHIFIEAGLQHCKTTNLTIFEVGFGTGLNALLTLVESDKSNLKINYITIEKYPLEKSVWQSLNYPILQQQQHSEVFEQLHSVPFNSKTIMNDNFSIEKIKADFTQFDFDSLPFLDLIYFDAFSPDKQPEMWTQPIFYALHMHCNHDAILVTYCAKGTIRRTMQQAGFNVERLPGPVGKREILRATKP